MDFIQFYLKIVSVITKLVVVNFQFMKLVVPTIIVKLKKFVIKFQLIE